MTIDQARESIVILNSGSGVIVQPMTDEYLYILTAKHNIENNNGSLDPVIRFTFNNGNWEEQELDIPDLHEGDNYFPHSTADAAIIKFYSDINFQEVYRLDSLHESKDGYNLLGYTEIRRNENPHDQAAWYRNDPDVKIVDTRSENEFEAQVPGNAGLNEILGHSGGGIVKIINEMLHLAGIQVKMASSEEQLGRIRFISLITFDEIVFDNSEILAPILPGYLRCFSFLKEQTFNLGAGLHQSKVDKVKKFLHRKTNEIISSDLTPIGIKEMFGSRLLLFKELDETLMSKGVWIIWLEFLTILNLLIENGLSSNNLSSWFDNVRLMYSSSKNDWASDLDVLLYSNYYGLKKNGIVVIGASKPPDLDHFVITKDTIPNISIVMDTTDNGMVQIDEGLTSPLNDFTFIHIDYFKNGAISKKHPDYEGLYSDAELLEKLKIEYQILLRNG